MIRIFYLVRDSLYSPEVPPRDSQVLFVMLILVISPIDFIPDFLLPLGIFDDIVLISTIFDYFFNYLDRDLLLKNWTGSLKSFNFVYRIGKILASMSPKTFMRRLWRYKPNPYR